MNCLITVSKSGRELTTREIGVRNFPMALVEGPNGRAIGALVGRRLTVSPEGKEGIVTPNTQVSEFMIDAMVTTYLRTRNIDDIPDQDTRGELKLFAKILGREFTTVAMAVKAVRKPANREICAIRYIMRNHPELRLLIDTEGVTIHYGYGSVKLYEESNGPVTAKPMLQRCGGTTHGWHDRKGGN